MTGGSVFVTGGHGLLGSWLVKALRDRGAQVTVLKRDRAVVSALTLGAPSAGSTSSPATSAMPRSSRGRSTRTRSIPCFISQSIASVAAAGPVATFESNVRGTWVLLEACRRQGVRRVVVAASVKVYGGHQDPPYREDLALTPRHPYDVSKAGRT